MLYDRWSGDEEEQMYPRMHRSSFRYGVPSVLLYLRDQSHTAEMPGCCAIHAANKTFRLLPIITDCEGFRRRVLRTFFPPFNVVVAVAYFKQRCQGRVVVVVFVAPHRWQYDSANRTLSYFTQLVVVRMYLFFVSCFECKNVHFSNVKLVYVSLIVLCIL